MQDNWRIIKAEGRGGPCAGRTPLLDLAGIGIAEKLAADIAAALTLWRHCCIIPS